MKTLEELNEQLFQPLSETESAATMGGYCYIGLCLLPDRIENDWSDDVCRPAF